MQVWIVREDGSSTHTNKSICRCGEQRPWVSHLTFKKKSDINTKGPLFPLQAKHKRSEGAQRWSNRGTAECFRKTLMFHDIHMVQKQGQILGDSPGITSQMGTSRVCSKLAKLHSNFPSNTPSQSPIGLSWKSWRHENLRTLPGVLHLWKRFHTGFFS